MVSDYASEYASTNWTINDGETWRVTVTPKSGDNYGPTASAQVTVNWRPRATPELKQVDLAGIEQIATGNAGWDLKLIPGVWDKDLMDGVEQQPFPYSAITWFVDRGDGLGFVETAVPNPELVSAELLEKGHSWKASVLPYNELEAGRDQSIVYGPVVEAGPIPFVNQAPRLSTVVAINASTGSDADGDGDATTVSRADRVDCVFELEDDDDIPSALSATVTWYTQNGNFVTDGPSTIDLNDYNTVSKGDELGCAVTPYDGDDYGNVVSITTPVTLGNAVPVIAQDGVAIRATTDADGDGSSATATEGDTVECYVDPAQLTDADKDSGLTLTYEWTINGVSAGTDQTLSAGFAIGDDLVCVATPDDIVDAYTGVPVSSQVLTVTGIPNTLPEVADATILPEPASAGEPLECDYSFSDADGDDDASTYAWTINGVTYTEWPWVALSQNWNQSCVVDSNGNAECWGEDDEGVISQTPRDIPMKKISVGSANHGCGITMSDEVVCWGLDDGSQYDYGQVTDVPAGRFKDIVAGIGYSCAITMEGGVECWGDDRLGQVSDVPTETNFVQIDASGDTILALNQDAEIVYWGEYATDFADWEDTYRQPYPLNDISMAFDTVCALQDDGAIDCWGDDYSSNYVILYAPWTKGFTDIAVALWHACAINKNGVVKCWGTDIYGEVNEAPTDSGYVAVDVGDSSSCALKATGEVICWGIDDGSPTDHGQVSDAPTGLGSTSAFLHSGGELGDVISCEVTAGDGQGVGNTIASPQVTLDNSIPEVSDVAISPADPGSAEPLVCEGTYSDAEGDPDQSIYAWTINGAVAEGVEWRSVSAGSQDSCAVDAVGQVVCWGKMFEGEAAQLTFPGSMYQAVDVGLYRTICAIDALGDIHCIEHAAGSYDELLDNIPTSAEYASLSVGFTAACALSSSGDLDCWGVDDGTSSATGSTNGIDYGQVTGAPVGTFMAVDLGRYLACAVDTSGGLACWGDAYSDFGTSVAMPSGSYVEVSVADEHACALTAAGEIECWGKDGQNQVSDTPSGTGFKKVETGFDRSCAIDVDGGVQCWGRNVFQTVSKSPSGANFEAISMGDNHSCAIDASNLLVCWGIDDPTDGLDFGQTSQTPVAYNPIGETLTAEFTSSGDEISCTITPFDGTVYGTPDSSDSVTVLNAAPVVSAVAISPDPANASDVLTCNYTFDDADTDPDQSLVVWAVEGVTLAENSDSDNDELTLEGGYAEGDVVECFVTANDGSSDGNTASASVTINTAPVVSNVVISPSRPTVSDTLICSYAYSDVDGDGDQSIVAWTVGGIEVGTGVELSGASLDAGDEVYCEVIPSDGIIVTGGQLANVTLNTPPVASSVAVTPSNRVGDTLTCGYLYADTDLDGETGTVIEWFVGAASAGTGTSLAGGFSVGDAISCAVTPSDGFESGLTVASASVTVANSVPTVSGVTVTSTTDLDGDANAATAGAETFFLRYTYDDEDGDAESGTLIEWIDNGGIAYGVTGSTLPSTEKKSRGEIVTCRVTPSDGVALGTPTDGTLSITNSLPTISSGEVLTSTDDDEDGDVTTMTSNDDLSCDITADDLDGDLLSEAVTWYVNGAEVTGRPLLRADPATRT